MCYANYNILHFFRLFLYCFKWKSVFLLRYKIILQHMNYYNYDLFKVFKDLKVRMFILSYASKPFYVLKYMFHVTEHFIWNFQRWQKVVLQKFIFFFCSKYTAFYKKIFSNDKESLFCIFPNFSFFIISRFILKRLFLRGAAVLYLL